MKLSKKSNGYICKRCNRLYLKTDLCCPTCNPSGGNMTVIVKTDGAIKTYRNVSNIKFLRKSVVLVKDGEPILIKSFTSLEVIKNDEARD